ncbi:MAG: MmcQ/YjbR family DNA-binding protein [Clostridia bacterium]|nr:MmcQ/YjbR family DNA-binding protein [Clostridia bacterium]
MEKTSKLSKNYIAEYLEEEFGDELERNVCDDLIDTGHSDADAYYAIYENGKRCFAYVYDANNAIVLLVCLNETYAESVRAEGHRIVRSAFPKSDATWYSIIVDDSYSEADIREILSDAYDMAKRPK